MRSLKYGQEVFNRRAAVQVQDRRTPSLPLGLPLLDMGQRACSYHAKSLSSHAGAVLGACWEPEVDGQCRHMTYEFYEAHA